MEESLQSNVGAGDSDQDQEVQLLAKMENARTLHMFLKAIHFREDSNFFVGDNGIKVTVEDAKSFQANAFIQREIFHEFQLNVNDLTFKLPLTPLLEILNMFGVVGSHAPALRLSYDGYGHPLRLFLEEDGVITDASIKTQETDETLDFNFSRSTILVKVIIISDYLKEIFNEIDNTSELIEFHICPTKKIFRLTTFGNCGDFSIDIPAHSDMISHFHVERLTIAKYKLSVLKHAFKPIALTEKVSIRMDSRDFLCLQYMIKLDEGTSFLEFYCAPEENMD